jgi:Protein of unknown function (DUF2384)
MTTAASMQGRILQRVQMPRTPYISPDAAGSVMGINKGRLAEIASLHRNTFRNPKSIGVQNALREIIRILTIAESLCGDTDRALFWFNNEPLADYDNQTPAELCARGQQAAVLGFLAEIEHGANG